MSGPKRCRVGLEAPHRLRTVNAVAAATPWRVAARVGRVARRSNGSKLKQYREAGRSWSSSGGVCEAAGSDRQATARVATGSRSRAFSLVVLVVLTCPGRRVGTITRKCRGAIKHTSIQLMCLCDIICCRTVRQRRSRPHWPNDRLREVALGLRVPQASHAGVILRASRIHSLSAELW